MDSKLDIPLHGSSLNIVKQFGPALSDIIQSKFGCVTTFDGVNFERGQTFAQQKRPTVVPEKRFEVTLRAGVRVSVWKADLTNFPADAVVNAANTRLQHYGGLALALSDVGGPQIQIDSDDYISRKGELRTGDAIVTDAGLLPYRKIIHAVGPQVSKYASGPEIKSAELQLEQAIRSILDRLSETNLQSVAIPAISSGLFNFPLPRCADVIVTTVKRYYENSSPRHSPRDIFLVNNDEPSVREMERACQQICMSYSQAATSKSKGAAKISAPTVKIENVHLTLMKGNIEQQQTDVIVNTVSLDRNLSIGQISKALSEKAGPGMQKELHTAFQSGNIIITSPYKLQCKNVYHTLCTDKGNYAAQQILIDAVHSCLQMAAMNHHRSIAFPAIGTGGLRFSKKEVAWIMTNAVSEFAQRSKERMDIYFVIFPSDNDTFQAFEEQIRSLQHKVPNPSSSHAFGHEGDFRDKAPTPQISLIGPSDEATREAEGWLSSLLSKPRDTVIISNNFIQYFGKEEYLQLSRLTRKGVSISECFENGRAAVIVHGDLTEDVAVAGLQVEAMLCKVQRDFVTEEERAMSLSSSKNVSFERKTVDRKSHDFSDRLSTFKNHGLRILKVDKVENPTLASLFDLKKNQLGSSTTRKMFQLIPAHFLQMVIHIGFHVEYAPPHDPAYGEGIYFAGTVKKAMDVWREKKEYLYFVEAEVLTGNCTSGKPGLILPPPVGTDPLSRYDSVSGGSDIAVIFSGYQALPKYIITCKVV